MTRLAVRSLVVACVTALSVVGAWSLRAVADEPVTEEKLTQLKQQADEAKGRKDAVSQQLKSAQEKAKSLSDELAKLKTALTMAQTALKTNEEKLKPAQEAATKADAAKLAAEKVFADTKAVADAAAKAAEEAAKKAKEEEAKAQAAQKAAADAFAVVNTEWVTKQRSVESGLISLGRMVSFSHSVAPIFAKRCLACHN